jgi:Calcineurin-like phosphoesterase
LISGFLLYSVENLDELIYALEDFNFAAVGDFACNSNTDATVDNIVDKNPELVFALGDYSHLPTGYCWFSRIGPIDSITKISIGNHDDDDSEGLDGHMDHFGLSQTSYSFNHENANILVLDTDRESYSSGSTQYNFAVNDLKSASQDPDIDWIIVYFHAPIYTSPAPCCSVSSALRDTLHPLFDEYGVDLVLAGDIHNYQRTFPIRYNANDPASPTITSTNASNYTDPEGAIYAIVGTGGFSLHGFSDKASFVSNQQDDLFGQLDIKITDNGNRMEGKFYRNSNNAILDSFSITK